MLAMDEIHQYERASLLKLIRLLLPGAVALNAYPNTPENHLLAAPEINTQLHNIAVLDRV
jgi:hypothetical protein